MSSTQTVLWKRHEEMPASPSSDSKKPGFFKRHLGHSRRSSNVSLLTGAATPHPPPAQPPAQPPAPAIAVRRPTEPVNEDTARRARSTDSQRSTGDALTLVTSRGSRGGVRWVSGFNDEQQRPRARRLSSGGGRSRRSSIYSRAPGGGYDEGVDAGVGSKARRLSVHIPESLQVDAGKLDDYFTKYARMVKKQIGEGGAATVQVMQSKNAGSAPDKLYAVKEFRPREPDEEDEAEYERKIKSEFAISKSCEHPNIVETFRLCCSHENTRWYHVMEFCSTGDINDAITRGYFSREDRQCLFKQLLRGVDYLHSRGIAHRDIKSENLLLAPTGCLKIADFGTSEVFSGQHPGLRRCRRPSLLQKDAEIRLCTPGLVGSRPYMAPELVKREEPYDARAVDVWSCAIVYITLLVGGTPWEEASSSVKNFEAYLQAWDRHYARFPDGAIEPERPTPQYRLFTPLGDPDTKRLVYAMLHPDPRRRWSAADALACPAVVDYPCCQQDGYSDDIRTRQRKARHNHCPPKKPHRGLGPLK